MSSEEVYTYIRNRGALYGTASAIAQTIEEFTDAGCRGFMVFCNSAPPSAALSNWHPCRLSGVRWLDTHRNSREVTTHTDDLAEAPCHHPPRAAA